MFIVTGGAGFIGSVIVAELNAKYPEKDVVVVDWLGTEDKWKNLNKRQISSIVFPEDMMNFVQSHADEIDAVIHMGAISATTEVDGDKLVTQNIKCSLDLFDWCAKTDTPMIYASSAATYGEGENGFYDYDNKAELSGLAPLNGYGFSKHMVDKAIITRKKQPSQWVGLKFFNVYGPNEYHKGGMQSVISHAFKQISETGKMKLFKSYNPEYGHGEQLRDFVYVKDIAQAVVWFYEHPNVSGLYNLGAGEARSFNDLVKATFKAMGKEVNIEYVEMPDHLKNQYQYYTKADMTKFKESLESYQDDKAVVFSTLEEGAADYVQNHLLKDDRYL